MGFSMKMTRAAAVVVTGIMGFSGVASAQNGPLGDPMGTAPTATGTTPPTQPTRGANDQRNDGRGRVMSPYWNENDSNDDQQSDLPAADIRAVPPARAAAVEAEWMFRRAEHDLEQVFRDANRAFNNSAEFRAALADEKAAWDVFRKARMTALEATMNDPVYKANEQLRADLTEQIKEMQDGTEPDNEKLIAISALKMEYSAPNRKLESAALERDENVKAARATLQTAALKVRDLKAKHDEALVASADLKDARNRLADLRIARLVTGAYLHSTINARDIALRYAYDVNGISRYRPNYYPYGNYSSYGGGFGYGYGIGIGGFRNGRNLRG